MPRSTSIGSIELASLNLNQLRVFEAVARTGSFSRAAEGLSVTQPAVTLQIRQLERDCPATRGRGAAPSRRASWPPCR